MWFPGVYQNPVTHKLVYSTIPHWIIDVHNAAVNAMEVAQPHPMDREFYYGHKESKRRGLSYSQGRVHHILIVETNAEYPEDIKNTPIRQYKGK